MPRRTATYARTMAKKSASGASGKPAKSRAPAKRSTKAKGKAGDGESESEPVPIEVPRPRPLNEMIGHRRAVGAMGTAFSSGRLHHAWIFAGPKGVGKFTAALGFAAAALDPTTKIGKDGVPTPDPRSRVQQMLTAGTHPDLHVVVKEFARFSANSKIREAKLRNIPLDVIKHHLIEPIELSSTLNEGGLASKVFIVDEAELIDPAGQNTLLKTLEEPPAGSLLILVTSAEERLLPTVRSRCQRVGFTPLSADDMRMWMESGDAFAEAGGRDVDPVIGDWMLSIAGGSPGRMIDTLGRGMAEWGPMLAPMLDQAVAGTFVAELGPSMAELAERLAVADVARNENASKEQANREAGRLLLHIVAERVRQSMGREPSDAGRFERAASAIEALQEAERYIDCNVHSLFVMESAVVGLTQAMSGAR